MGGLIMPLRDQYRIVREIVGSESQARSLVTKLNKRASSYIKEYKPARYTVDEVTDEEGNTVKRYTVWHWI